MDKSVTLTKQHKDLLLYFLNNQDVALSKNSLIEHIWKGRTVADNTIDQSISKLKKILNECQPDKYFETVYGQGTRFLPKVYKSHEKFNHIKPVVLSLILLIFMLLFALHTYFSSSAIETDADFGKKQQQIFLMVVPQYHQKLDSGVNNKWLNDSSWIIFEQLIKYGKFTQLKPYNKKPKNLNSQQYLDYLWGISHDLNTLSVNLSQNNNTYTLVLELTNNKQQKSSYKWSYEKLNLVFFHANKWLNQQFNHPLPDKNLLPENSYLIELYMRGLSSLRHRKLVKASHFFELDISENPVFILARLELVKIKIIQGRGKDALALLDVMNGDSLPVKISIEVTKLRSKAYEIENELELAGEMLKDTIIKFKSSDYPEINELRYELSAIYLRLKHYDLALTELKNISVGISENPELVAMVLQQQAVIYLHTKNFLKAEQKATKSLEIYTKLGDSLSLANSHQLLAKIAVAEPDNKSAETHLLQALSIHRSLSVQIESNLVIIDILNELILVLIDQGQLTRAIQLNQQLQQIAVSQNLTNILIDSKSYSIIIAMKQKNWSLAKQELQTQKVLADDTNNLRGLINNQLLNIELLLNQNSIEGVELLFSKLQSDIPNTQGDFWLLRENILRARYYILENKIQKAISLLITTKSLAKSGSKSRPDNKTVVEINNILAQQYLIDKQINKAMTVLQESVDYKPFAYPYLLLKSKASRQLGKNMKALELALESSRKSSQLWSKEDDDYLNRLVELNKSL